jgi:SAM-dependent methyltransferase
MDAASWDDRYTGSELVWSAEPNQFVEAETASLAPGRALDMGAGEGRNAIWLAQQGWTVSAVDFSRVGLAKGEHAADELGVGARVEWICADVRTWSPPAPAYDLVVVAYLHLAQEDLARVVAHAGAGLRPGGKLVGVGHDLVNLRDGVGGPQDPAVLWTPGGLRSLLTNSGLTVDTCSTVERSTPAGTAYDTLVTATAPE